MALCAPFAGNLLLETLSPDILRQLAASEEDHRIRDVLVRSDETPHFVFFPHFGAVVSIVRSTESGAMIEAGVVGHEGMFSVHTVITKPAPTGSQAVVQIDGRISRIDAGRLHERFRRDEQFHDLLLSFTSLFLHQVTQNLLCNRLHPIEQRLSKWLLIIRDRIAREDLHLTQDFLSYMLGVYRPGVSIGVHALQADGLITHSRNYISIRNHEGLRARSCECYATLNGDLARFRAAV
jgi:CRP-like cAMP-binding protein